MHKERKGDLLKITYFDAWKWDFKYGSPHYQVTALIREHIRADLKLRTVLRGLSAEYDIVGTHMPWKKLSINQQCILTSGWCTWSRLYFFSTRCIQVYQERHPEMHSHTKVQLKKREEKDETEYLIIPLSLPIVQKRWRASLQENTAFLQNTSVYPELWSLFQN